MRGSYCWAALRGLGAVGSEERNPGQGQTWGVLVKVVRAWQGGEAQRGKRGSGQRGVQAEPCGLHRARKEAAGGSPPTPGQVLKASTSLWCPLNPVHSRKASRSFRCSPQPAPCRVGAGATYVFAGGLEPLSLSIAGCDPFS